MFFPKRAAFEVVAPGGTCARYATAHCLSSPFLSHLLFMTQQIHCLPFTTRIEFKVLFLVLKSPLGSAPKGPSIKYVTFEREGVVEGVTVCDRGRGSKACDITLINFCIIHMKHDISSY